MISPTPASDAKEAESTAVAPLSNDVMSQKGKDEQVTSLHDSNEIPADVAETNVFQTSRKGQDSILIGPDSNDSRMYVYLTRQAAKLYEEFPPSVKGCVHSADILVGRNSEAKDNV